jgi:hypothetical protein
MPSYACDSHPVNKNSLVVHVPHRAGNASNGLFDNAAERPAAIAGLTGRHPLAAPVREEESGPLTAGANWHGARHNSDPAARAERRPQRRGAARKPRPSASQAMPRTSSVTAERCPCKMFHQSSNRRGRYSRISLLVKTSICDSKYAILMRCYCTAP